MIRLARRRMLVTSKGPEKLVKIPTRGALTKKRPDRTVPLVPKLKLRLRTTHRK